MFRFLALFFAFATGAIMMALLGPNERAEQNIEPTSLTLSQKEVIPEKPETTADKSKQEKAKIAIVIDDLGDNIRTGDVIALDLPLTLAFLPDDRSTPALSELAARKGHDVLLHMPMQSKGYENREQSLLKKDMIPSEIESLLKSSFARVPSARGLNNHTGSAFTEDEAGMQTVLSYAKKHELLYLDSKTTAASAAQNLSEQLDYPILTRHVFLDHFEEKEMVEKALLKTQAIAERHGAAIAIGHPKTNTIEAIKDWAETLDPQRFELVGIHVLNPVKTAQKTKPVAQLSDQEDQRRASGL